MCGKIRSRIENKKKQKQNIQKKKSDIDNN